LAWCKKRKMGLETSDPFSRMLHPRRATSWPTRRSTLARMGWSCPARERLARVETWRYRAHTREMSGYVSAADPRQVSDSLGVGGGRGAPRQGSIRFSMASCDFSRLVLAWRFVFSQLATFPAEAPQRRCSINT
jgi:hypothetical protein